MQVFSDSQIVNAMKLFLPKRIMPAESFTEKQAQEWAGMPLRKTALRRALNNLLADGFLQKNDDDEFALVQCAIVPISTEVQLFPSSVIAHRLFQYLSHRFKDQDLAMWSQHEMQDEDWKGMCLRKRAIVEAVNTLVDQLKIHQVGLYMYQLVD